MEAEEITAEFTELRLLGKLEIKPLCHIQRNLYVFSVPFDGHKYSFEFQYDAKTKIWLKNEKGERSSHGWSNNFYVVYQGLAPTRVVQVTP